MNAKVLLISLSCFFLPILLVVGWQVQTDIASKISPRNGYLLYLTSNR